MKRRKIRWKILASLILGILIMAAAFILISGVLFIIRRKKAAKAQED